ncbi:hypothetical protein IMSAGC005_01710 [Lachnospiraceae bacterium]|nr:hypothetical protein IMSAGC005_01710 [Lachnospiraceae bacterium]
MGLQTELGICIIMVFLSCAGLIFFRLLKRMKLVVFVGIAAAFLLFRALELAAALWYADDVKGQAQEQMGQDVWDGPIPWGGDTEGRSERGMPVFHYYDKGTGNRQGEGRGGQ